MNIFAKSLIGDLAGCPTIFPRTDYESPTIWVPSLSFRSISLFRPVRRYEDLALIVQSIPLHCIRELRDPNEPE